MLKVGDRVTYLDSKLQDYVGRVIGFAPNLPGFVIIRWMLPTGIRARERASNLMKINTQ